MKHTISVLVENNAGVLSRVAGLFARRGYNIYSLAVGVTEDEKVSRITIVAEGSDHTLEQIEKQLNKLIDVIKVKTVSKDEMLSRELMLAKINCAPAQRQEILSIAEITRAKISDISANSITLEMSGDNDSIKTFEDLVRPYGIKEIVRTGTVAVQKGDAALKI